MSYTPPTGESADLIYSGVPYTPNTGSDTTLDFAQVLGGSDVFIDYVLEDITAELQVLNTNVYSSSIDFTLEDLLAEVWVAQVYNAQIGYVMDDLSVEAEALWFSGVWRGIWMTTDFPQETLKTLLEIPLASPHAETRKLFAQPGLPWQLSDPTPSEDSFGWVITVPSPLQESLAWERAGVKVTEILGGYASPEKQAIDRTNSWGPADTFRLDQSSIYASPPRRPLAMDFLFEKPNWHQISYLFPFGWANNRFAQDKLPWEQGDPHSWIFGGWPDPPPPPPPPPYTPSPNLVFKPGGPDGTELNFDPIKLNGVIIVLHTVHVVRLPDLTPVPTLSASLQLDSDSWAWGVSLNLQTPQAMALLEPVNGEPRQVRIELDGLYFNALIESWGESRQFGETLYTAQGRSPLALLAAPFAPQRSRVETSNATAAQLIDYELTNTGWSAAYHSDLQQLFVMDWQIPGGAWSYQNLAPVEAVARVAKAIGARAFADKTGQVIHIAPRYPVSPWHWATATPDKTLPVSLARSINTQLNPQPAYNQVYVSGTTQGVIVSVKRTGSAGDNPAPMVTDAIMTHADAGRERGRNILGNTGRQARVTFDLPLNPVTGLFEPGQLVAVQDSVNWRGLVTAVNLQASHGAISQSVELERHYA